MQHATDTSRHERIPRGGHVLPSIWVHFHGSAADPFGAAERCCFVEVQLRFAKVLESASVESLPQRGVGTELKRQVRRLSYWRPTAKATDATWQVWHRRCPSI